MHHHLKKKIDSVVWSLIVAALCIVTRLFYVQIHQRNYFIQQSQKNFLRVAQTAPVRGSIFDRNMRPLATNRPVHAVYWHGTGNRQLNAAQKETLNFVTQTLGDEKKDFTLVQIGATERWHRKKLLAYDISHQTLCRLAEGVGDTQNIVIETDVKRHYPYKHYASHTIGYLGSLQLENRGKMGLEKLCEPALRGTRGTVLKSINSWGKHVDNTELASPFSGSDICTTMDLDIQQISESVFPEHHAGALVVMNPQNGDIISIVSRPGFDPAMFLAPIPHTQWQSLQHNNAFLNRALSSYPPGSIFKLVTISAALEHNIIDPNATWNCKGYVTFAKRKYWCARKYGHGILSTKKAMAESCNIPLFEIGKQIDIDLLAQYAHKFGLGTETGFMFPEKKGLVPSRHWKMTTRGEPWWPGETLSVSIGQSFLLATPLQIARMIGSIFTNYLVKPRLLIDEPITTEQLNIQPETLHFLKRSMKSVIRSGTGKKIKSIKDIAIYAKTSTAQMSGLDKRSEGAAYFEHGWFAGYVEYKTCDPLVVVILVEHAGTSQIPTIIAKNFLIQYKKLMNR